MSASIESRVLPSAPPQPHRPEPVLSPLDFAAGDANWPRISIVMPSLNQGVFVEEAIRSVVLQDYPDVELIVADGGSTDGSIDVFRKYSAALSRWMSERDRGPAHALNKGFRYATGEIFGFLNADD